MALRSASQSPSPSDSSPAWARPGVAIVILLAAAFAAYFTSFGGAFVFDDIPAIMENETIRTFGGAFFPPPGGLTVSGRPVLNFTLAVNHLFGGTNPWGYHAGNLLIHALAGLTLYGLVRRTLALPSIRPELRAAAEPLALAVALLWTVHPLQTESVTYVVQRAESLVGLFYLGTLYAFVRGATSESPLPWYGLSVVSCLCGVGTKEVIVTVPVVVLFYDRTFLGGTFAAAVRQRGRIHLAIAATWLPLFWLVMANGGGTRGGTAGLGLGVAFWRYGLTQFEAVTRYVALSFWPHPLVFEYGTFWVQSPAQVLYYVPGVLLLVGGTVWALWRRPALGFLGACFLGVLAPTSLVPGTLQMVVEHRMYLPLAAVLTAGVVGLFGIAGRRTWMAVAILALAGTVVTARRNLDYQNVVAIWADTVAKRPGNAFARNNLGNALADAGRMEEAVAEYSAAIARDPKMPDARYNLGLALISLGRPEEAIAPLEQSLRLRPAHARAESSLAEALLAVGRANEAVSHFEAARALAPEDVALRFNLAAALAQAGRPGEAIGHYRDLLRAKPGDANGWGNFGNALAASGRREDAVAAYREAIRLQPGHALAHYNLGNALLALERPAEAVTAYADAVRLAPDDADVRNNYGIALSQLGRVQEAVREFGEAVRLRPDFAAAKANWDALRR